MLSIDHLDLSLDSWWPDPWLTSHEASVEQHMHIRYCKYFVGLSLRKKQASNIYFQQCVKFFMS